MHIEPRPGVIVSVAARRSILVCGGGAPHHRPKKIGSGAALVAKNIFSRDPENIFFYSQKFFDDLFFFLVIENINTPKIASAACRQNIGGGSSASIT